MNKNNTIYYSQGATLIEMVASIVIIAIVTSGVMAMFLGTSKSSADPMVRAQQLAIAQSYMDEILMQPYSLDGATAGRTNYNEVNDYHTSGAYRTVQDRFGRTLSSLSAYAVKVDVTTPGLSGLNDVKKIVVTVSSGALGTEVPVTAYRSDY